MLCQDFVGSDSYIVLKIDEKKFNILEEIEKNILK